MNKTNNFFSIKKLGWAEMLVALLPILGAYSLGTLPFSLLILLSLSLISIARGNKIGLSMVPVIVFVLYYIIHALVLEMVSINGININRHAMQLVNLSSIIFIVPMLDLKKLTASLNFVSLICIIGLLFQLATIMTGGTVHPLEIPGLKMAEVRLEHDSIRPSSFFMEPAAYSAYMYAPLTLSLINREYWWSAVLIVAMFLTTSTTALFAAFIILGVYVFSRGEFKRGNLMVIILGIGLFYALNHLSIFNTSMEKLENTDFETTGRIHQGPELVGTMHWYEIIFGAPYRDSADYASSGRTDGTKIMVYGGQVYMSTTWLMIFYYGVVGLLLYILIFYRLARRCRELWPYVICLYVTMFTAAMHIGTSYVYTVIVLYVIANQLKTDNYTLEIQQK